MSHPFFIEEKKKGPVNVFFTNGGRTRSLVASFFNINGKHDFKSAKVNASRFVLIMNGLNAAIHSKIDKARNASGEANTTELVVGRRLLTKDGRIFGNGIIFKIENTIHAGKDVVIYHCATDYGNKMVLTAEEIENNCWLGDVEENLAAWVAPSLIHKANFIYHDTGDVS